MSSAEAVCADLRACLTFSGGLGREADVEIAFPVEPVIFAPSEVLQKLLKRSAAIFNTRGQRPVRRIFGYLNRFLNF